MFYFKFTLDIPYCETDLITYQKLERRPTNAELDEIAENLARKTAINFESLVTSCFDDGDEDEPTEELENYFSNC